MIQMHQENNVQVKLCSKLPISISLLLLMVLIPLAVEIAKPFIVGSSIGSSTSTQSQWHCGINGKMCELPHCNTTYTYDHVGVIPPSSSDHYSLPAHHVPPPHTHPKNSNLSVCVYKIMIGSNHTYHMDVFWI